MECSARKAGLGQLSAGLIVENFVSIVCCLLYICMHNAVSCLTLSADINVNDVPMVGAKHQRNVHRMDP